MCLSAKDTGFLSVLQFLSQDGTIGRIEGGTSRACTKPQIAQAFILANHAHTLLSLGLKVIYTHICTLLYTAGHTLPYTTPDREGIPQSPDATTMVLSTIFKIWFNNEIAGNSVPSYSPCNVVHYFFNFTFRGFTKSKGQVLHEYIRTYSEYMYFTQFIMHKYIHAYSRLCCMHHEG